MVDSSYTVPSNPNTMRDGGPCRNAVYTVNDEAEQEYLRRSQQTFGRTLASFSQVPINIKDLERARESLNSRCMHVRPHSSFGHTQSRINSSQSSAFLSCLSYGTPSKYTPYVVDKVEVVRTNDYTKNISGSIFSPGLTQKLNTKIASLSPLKAANPSRQHKVANARSSLNLKPCLKSPQKSIVSQKSAKVIRDEILREKEVRFEHNF